MWVGSTHMRNDYFGNLLLILGNNNYRVGNTDVSFKEYLRKKLSKLLKSKYVPSF